MTTQKKVSVLPIYLVGFAWLGYALLFPLRAPLHYALCAGLSLVVYTIGKAIWPDKVYQTPDAPKTEAKKTQPKLYKKKKTKKKNTKKYNKKKKKKKKKKNKKRK